MDGENDDFVNRLYEFDFEALVFLTPLGQGIERVVWLKSSEERSRL